MLTFCSQRLGKHFHGLKSKKMLVKMSSAMMSTAKASSAQAASLWARYNHHLVANPITTKCITAGVLATAADIVCQINFPLDPETKKKPAMDRVDWKRTLNFAVLNTLMVPPVMHWWYGLLSTRIVGTTFMAAVKRVFFDQSIFAPLFVAIFFAANLSMDGKIDQIGEKLRIDWLPTLLANYSVWIPAQLINFKLVPPPLRVLWANFIGFFWSIYLSNAANKKSEPGIPTAPSEMIKDKDL